MKKVTRTIERKFDIILKDIEFTQKWNEENQRFQQHFNVYGENAQKMLQFKQEEGFMQKLHNIYNVQGDKKSGVKGVGFNLHSNRNHLENIREDIHEDYRLSSNTTDGSYVGNVGFNVFPFTYEETNEDTGVVSEKSGVTLKAKMLFAHAEVETKFIVEQMPEMLDFNEQILLEYDTEQVEE